VVDFKTLIGREIAHKLNTRWDVGTVRCLEKNGEFAAFYESDQQLSKHKLSKHEINKVDYGVHK